MIQFGYISERRHLHLGVSGFACTMEDVPVLLG